MSIYKLWNAFGIRASVCTIILCASNISNISFLYSCDTEYCYTGDVIDGSFQTADLLGPIIGPIVEPIVEPILKPIVEGVEDVIDEAVKRGDEVLRSSATNMNEVLKSADKETRKAIGDALSSTDKAVADSASALLKAANDLVEAAQAAERFGKRNLQTYPDALSRSAQRLREGKVADAIWHIGTDQIRERSDTAAKATQESELIARVTEGAVGSYGGPAGAAAYAAWKAYYDSGGNLDLSIKAGVYAYALRSGYADANALPTGTAGEAIRKAATTGAVAGAAVAASGGTSEDTLKAFLKSGGEVLFQSGQSYVQEQYVDPARADGDMYCRRTLGGACNEAKGWYQSSKELASNAHETIKDGPTISLTSDGQWAMSWNRDAIFNPELKVPGVTITYVGEHSPYAHEAAKIAKLGVTSQRVIKPSPVFLDDPFGDLSDLKLPEDSELQRPTTGGDPCPRRCGD